MNSLRMSLTSRFGPLLAFLFLLSVASSVLRAEVASGAPAPDFSLTDLSGKTRTLAEFRGKVVVLEWVNPECPFVKHHYQSTGNIPALQKEAAASGVVWLSINSGRAGAQGDLSTDKVREWMQQTAAAPHAYFRDQDGKVGRLYGAKTTPHLFVIGADGVLLYQGAIDDARGFDVAATKKARNYVREVLNSVAQGKAPEFGSKSPYGCSVKY